MVKSEWVTWVTGQCLWLIDLSPVNRSLHQSNFKNSISNFCHKIYETCDLFTVVIFVTFTRVNGLLVRLATSCYGVTSVSLVLSSLLRWWGQRAEKFPVLSDIARWVFVSHSKFVLANVSDTSALSCHHSITQQHASRNCWHVYSSGMVQKHDDQAMHSHTILLWDIEAG